MTNTLRIGMAHNIKTYKITQNWFFKCFIGLSIYLKGGKLYHYLKSFYMVSTYAYNFFKVRYNDKDHIYISSSTIILNSRYIYFLLTHFVDIDIAHCNVVLYMCTFAGGKKQNK